ncbi:hypothetical protein Riggi_7 [Bacillus phage Riggi]|uniref:Uncharacterized protein n=1 Tax=Bacillus phage Riggi TaxID=2884426 RepID=U5PW67_9CAUD|nr:hypothetical protein Riggi_7 [Bacillus phage Riggi]AGY48169.1 hypothetical protein Riggi_7 [Bacillus phage Riggi]
MTRFVGYTSEEDILDFKVIGHIRVRDNPSELLCHKVEFTEDDIQLIYPVVFEGDEKDYLKNLYNQGIIIQITGFSQVNPEEATVMAVDEYKEFVGYTTQEEMDDVGYDGKTFAVWKKQRKGDTHKVQFYYKHFSTLIKTRPQELKDFEAGKDAFIKGYKRVTKLPKKYI